MYRYFLYNLYIIFVLEFDLALVEKYDLFVVGISYKTADINVRGKFSLNDTQQHALFLDAKKSNIKDDCNSN